MRLCNHCCSGNAVSITYSECVFVALVIQHAMQMCHIVICSLSGFSIFFHMSRKWYNFQKEVSEYKMCVFIFSKTFV